MKCKLLKLVALALLPMQNMDAQVWKGSDLSEGSSYYLYNIGAKQFLLGANDAGVQASVGVPGVLCTLNPAERRYTIDTGISNGGDAHYLNHAGYLDGEAAPWTFTNVGTDEAPVYTISKAENEYLGYDGTNTALSLTLTNPDSDQTRWLLVSRQERLDALESATKELGIDASFLISCPNFSRNEPANAWSGGPAIGGEGYNLCAEKFNCAYDVYQELSGIPNGTYEVSCQGFYRAGWGAQDNPDTRNALLYANFETFPLMHIADEDISTLVPNNMGHASQVFSADKYTNNKVKVTVTDGKLRIGIKKNVLLGGDWTIFDNFRLTYYGIDLDELKTTLDNLLEKVNTYHENYKDALNAPINQILTDASQAGTNVENAEEQLNAAINTLNQAVALINESPETLIATIRKGLISFNETYNNTTAPETDKQNFKNAIDKGNTDTENATTVEKLNQIIAELRAARYTYMQVANPMPGKTIDLSFRMTNASVINADGWTDGNTAWGQQYTGAPDNTYLDNWGAIRDMYQIITVPMGIYKLTAATRADANILGGYIYLNEAKADIEKKGNGGNTLGNGWAWTSTEEVLVISEAKIGFYSECYDGNERRWWAGADDFKLEMIHAVTPESRSTTDGNYGTVCLPYPAICQGGNVYKIAGKSSDNNNIYLELCDKMEAGVPYIYKSTGEGVTFYQILDENSKATAASTANGLVGCLDNVTVEANENRYALNKDNVWYKIDKTITTNRRAYIDLSQINVMEEESSTENRVAMRILIPEDANGIKAVTTEQSKDNAVYTLSGIRVDNTRNLNKGIYIRDGKKFIVK